MRLVRFCCCVVFACAALIPASTALAVTTVNFGTVSQFTGPADLNLDPANVVYAVNFSNNDPDLTINGVTFLHDRQVIPGFSSVGPNQVTPWQNKPEYGAGADNDNLEQMMNDIRWANAGGGQSLTASADVTAGNDYRLQLLISGNHPESRNWDIRVEGADAVDEITSLGESGETYDVGRSTVYTTDIIGSDGQINVEMGNFFGANDGGDRNPIWQGLIVTDITQAAPVPEPGSIIVFLIVAVIGIAGASFARRRQRR